ncbi:hypothetical protein PENTCL1PPCAC_29152, partial [Pristionchus entomophagus]
RDRDSKCSIFHFLLLHSGVCIVLRFLFRGLCPISHVTFDVIDDGFVVLEDDGHQTPQLHRDDLNLTMQLEVLCLQMVHVIGHSIDPIDELDLLLLDGFLHD